MGTVFTRVAELNGGKWQKYFVYNLRLEIFTHKILLIVEEVVQIVSTDTPLLPAWQSSTLSTERETQIVTGISWPPK